MELLSYPIYLSRKTGMSPKRVPNSNAIEAKLLCLPRKTEQFKNGAKFKFQIVLPALSLLGRWTAMAAGVTLRTRLSRSSTLLRSGLPENVLESISEMEFLFRMTYCRLRKERKLLQ